MKKTKKRKAAPKKTARTTAYHHGDLRETLRSAATTLLEEEGLAGFSLRAVARKAGVSHAAPYRHYPNHEALLAELVHSGLMELHDKIAAITPARGAPSERIAAIGAAYMRFAVGKPALMRLMFGPQLPDRTRFPEIAAAVGMLVQEIESALGSEALGLAAWSAVHGLTMLALDDLIDLGQSTAGRGVLASRAEIILRCLLNAE
jgi:AcrR family transcriptional regulator